MRAWLVPLALLLWALGCSSGLPPRTPRPGEAVVRIVTYNVNYGLAGDPATIAPLADGWADVVVLQETNEAWEAALRAGLGQQYPYMMFHHCCLAGGLGVLSKRPLRAVKLLEPRHGWFPAWLVRAETPIGELQLLNVHLRPPVSEGGSVVSGYFSTPPVREAEIKHYLAELDPGVPTLVAGDFNEGRGGRALRHLERVGFRSALPRFSGPQDTWRWTTSAGTVHSQLDHLVHDARLDPLAAKVVTAGRSDHLPVRGTFRLSASAIE